jgi:hypothetical protein
MATLINGKWTTFCGKTRGRNKKGDFSKERAEQHEKTCTHCINGILPEDDENWALEMADLIAGDESDGVYWGIAYEHGYFG